MEYAGKSQNKKQQIQQYEVGTQDPIAAIRSQVSPGQKIVFASGNFNIVHPGHLRLLRFASDCGDFLVVGVYDHRSPGSTLPEDLRLDSVRAVGLVDYAFILRESPEAFIAKLKPDIVVKGKEHEVSFNPEREAIEAYGGKLFFGSGDISFSSLDLLRQEFNDLNFSTIKKPVDYLERHNFDFGDLRKLMKSFSDVRACVFGDLIVDEYITCDAVGMSQEDPTIVVTPVQEQRFIGGSAIVAAHAKSMGAQVEYFTICGPDEAAEFARTQLGGYGVNSSFFVDECRPTTLKQRFRAGNKTLLRVSRMRQHSIGKEIADNIFEKFESVARSLDIVIFSDFNYGCLPQALVDRVVDLCRDLDIPMLADSQSSSQLGDISRFKGMLLVTPTEREARLAVRDHSSGLVVLAETLRRQSRAKNIFITLGAEGALIYGEDSSPHGVATDRLPAMNFAPKDSAGAGDSMLACAALSLACGADIWKSAYLGSIAAACQVGRMGNVPLTQSQIAAELGCI